MPRVAGLKLLICSQALDPFRQYLSQDWEVGRDQRRRRDPIEGGPLRTLLAPLVAPGKPFLATRAKRGAVGMPIGAAEGIRGCGGVVDHDHAPKTARGGLALEKARLARIGVAEHRVTTAKGWVVRGRANSSYVVHTRNGCA